MDLIGDQIEEATSEGRKVNRARLLGPPIVPQYVGARYMPLIAIYLMVERYRGG